MKELTNFQMNFVIDGNKFQISENPLGQENIFMIPKPKEKGLFNTGIEFKPVEKKGSVTR